MRNCFVYSCRLTSGSAGVTSGPGAFRCPGRGGVDGLEVLVVDCVVDSVLLSGAGAIEHPHRSLPEVMMEQVFNLTGDLGIGSDSVALQRKCGLFWPMSDITLKAFRAGGG